MHQRTGDQRLAATGREESQHVGAAATQFLRQHFVERFPPERIDAVAQGRVWTGEQAKARGLVDELGGMSKAISETKKMLGMKTDEKIALVAYPKEMGLMDVLQKAMGGSTTSARVSAVGSLLGPKGIDPSSPVSVMWSSLPHGLRQALQNAASVGRMLQKEHVLAVMPAIPQVN